MSRSSKKGYYVNPKLEKKALHARLNNIKKPIKTWARNSTITPDYVGMEFHVHNGKIFFPVYVTENMVGHKFGEFSMTRTFKSHGGQDKK